MQDYNFTFKYIPRETNIIADLLSRRQDLNEGVSTEKQIMLPNSFFHIRKISPHANNNDLFDSLLTWKIYLKDDLDEQHSALQEIYDSPARGHPSIANTWDLVKCQYEGPQLRQFIEDYVKGCAKCQESKPITSKPKAPLLQFDTHTEEGLFQYISMDLIMDLPRSEGYDTILMIVDQGTRGAARPVSSSPVIRQ
jgi:hypothetical protein